MHLQVVKMDVKLELTVLLLQNSNANKKQQILGAKIFENHITMGHNFNPKWWGGPGRAGPGLMVPRAGPGRAQKNRPVDISTVKPWKQEPFHYKTSPEM